MPDDTAGSPVQDTSPWTTAWLTPEVAEAQSTRMKNEYLDWCNGKIHEPFTAFEALAKQSCAASMLDIGCGAGIYYDVFMRSPTAKRYLGCDQARSMVYAAQADHRGGTYIIADAAALPLANKSFMMVLLGGIINCTEFWEPIVAESVRLARKCILFHRVPLYLDGPDTKIVMRDVYGHQAPEREFNANFFRGYIEKLGDVTASRAWSRGAAGQMASFLVELESDNDA